MPSFGGPSMIFALDYNPTCGHVCLVYNPESEKEGKQLSTKRYSSYFNLVPSLSPPPLSLSLSLPPSLPSLQVRHMASGC